MNAFCPVFDFNIYSIFNILAESDWFYRNLVRLFGGQAEVISMPEPRGSDQLGRYFLRHLSVKFLSNSG